MQQPYAFAYPAAASPPQPVAGTAVPIVDPRYCAPYPVDFAIERKVKKITDGHFVVTDVKGKLWLKVKMPVFGIHDKRILLDATGSPVVTLREKLMSLHNRWQVFRGESTEPGDLLYTVKRSSMVQFKTKLDIFLANNKDEKICDYRVKGSWFKSSCVVYAGESDTIVAQMHKKESIFRGKESFSVTIYPHVDYAFIVSLIVILDDVNEKPGGRSSMDFQVVDFLG